MITFESYSFVKVIDDLKTKNYSFKIENLHHVLARSHDNLLTINHDTLKGLVQCATIHSSTPTKIEPYKACWEKKATSRRI